MAFTGLGSQPRNFGAAANLAPGQGGPVMRRPPSGLGRTAQFSQQDEMARLGQNPTAPMDYGGTLGLASSLINQHQEDRADQFDPQQPQPMTPQMPASGFTTRMPGQYAPGIGKYQPIIQPTQYRAAGGGVRRTRQFAPGTAAVPYGNRGQELVTGGTGAAPALPGRIGYRGQLQSAPSEQPGAGLDWLRQGRTQGILNQGAKAEVDPVSGLSNNPTEAQIDAQLRMLAGQGDEPGLEGQGLGGTRRASTLAAYYQAKQGGDPTAIQQASDAVQGLKRTIQTTRSQQAQAPAAPSPVAPETPGQTVPPPLGTTPAGDGSTSAGADEEESLKNSVGALKKGGPASTVHPYIVNEQGEEAFKPDGGKPELMPGPEHMTTFPENGTVIPHGRTMRMMKEGMIQPAEENPVFPATPVKHLAAGGRGMKTRGFAGPLQRLGILPEGSPLAGLERRGAGLIAGGINSLKYPFVEPEQPTLAPHVFPVAPVADIAGPPIPGETAIPGFDWRYPLAEQSSSPPLPAGEMGDDQEMQENAPIASTPEGSGWLDNLLGQIRQPAAQAQQHAAQNVVAANAATNAIMQNPGVERIAPLQGQDRSFLTPYGTAGVKFKAKGGKVHRTRQMAGMKY